MFYWSFLNEINFVVDGRRRHLRRRLYFFVSLLFIETRVPLSRQNNGQNEPDILSCTNSTS